MVVALVVVVVWVQAIMSPAHPDLSEASVDHLGESGEAAVERRYVIVGGIVLSGVMLAVLFGLGRWNMGSSPRRGALEVVVVGHQYWWEVTCLDAPGADGPFETANELHVPVGTEVTVLLRSEDVIHNFSVPQLVGKVDLVPGRENRLTFSADELGTYTGYCAEFCGLQHAWMKFEVVAMQPAEFDRWVANPSRPAPSPKQRGLEVWSAATPARRR